MKKLYAAEKGKGALATCTTGSATYDLCYVAAGRLDGDWELKLETWDAAAATLIVKEAGGVVTQLDGQPYHHLNKNLLASNGLLHQAVLDVLRKSSKFYEEAREKGNQEFIFILS